MALLSLQTVSLLTSCLAVTSRTQWRRKLCRWRLMVSGTGKKKPSLAMWTQPAFSISQFPSQPSRNYRDSSHPWAVHNQKYSQSRTWFHLSRSASLASSNTMHVWAQIQTKSFSQTERKGSTDSTNSCSVHKKTTDSRKWCLGHDFLLLSSYWDIIGGGGGESNNFKPGYLKSSWNFIKSL